MIDQKPTPTREQVWAHLLRLWHTNNLPTPREITVTGYEVAEVRLEDNDRAAVNAWAAALGLGDPQMKQNAVGAYGYYKAGGIGVDKPKVSLLPDWSVAVSCHLDLAADASAHWSGPVDSSDPREQLAAALAGAR